MSRATAADGAKVEVLGVDERLEALRDPGAMEFPYMETGRYRAM